MEAVSPRDFVRELLGVALAIRKRVRVGLIERGHDLNPSHTAVIPNLPEGGLQLGELAQRLGVSIQRAGQLVGELRKAGYVELSGDESDRRAKRVRYSARGQRLIRDADAIDDELWQELTDRFGSRTIEDLGAAIRELHGALVGRDRPLLLEPAAARARSRKRLRPRRA